MRVARPRHHRAARRPGGESLRKGIYILPSLFTVGNMLCGFASVLYALHDQLERAGYLIILAGLLDGLDGRIARLTHSTSEFGKEYDSLADVISFGIAPAVLAFAWGVQFVDTSIAEGIRSHLFRAGYFIAFLFLLCGAARLARFNVQKNPIPKNPGNPHRKYFVGLPIPAAAGMVCAVVFAFGGQPLAWWPLSVAWLALLVLLGFLMVCTWRYYSFKGINLNKPYTPLLFVLLGGLIYGIWNWPQPVLLAMACAYVASGSAIRIGGIVRRRLRRAR